ncbi:MAG: GFA family protein [Pseudomonadota bacterium]
MANVTGGCLCGDVRFTSSQKPLSARICWCRTCRYFAAGNGTVNVVFPTDGFEVTGDMADFVSAADSGSRMHRRFCKTCGTQLFSEAESRPHLIIVRAGALDDQSLVAPTAHIWTREAPDWACLDPDLERIEGQPPAPPPPT